MWRRASHSTLRATPMLGSRELHAYTGQSGSSSVSNLSGTKNARHYNPSTTSRLSAKTTAAGFSAYGASSTNGIGSSRSAVKLDDPDSNCTNIKPDLPSTDNPKCRSYGFGSSGTASTNTEKYPATTILENGIGEGAKHFDTQPNTSSGSRGLLRCAEPARYLKMDDEQIKEDHVEKEGNDKDDDQAYRRGIVCNTSNVRVILSNMTKRKDFAKGTKALETKEIITKRKCYHLVT